MNLNDFYFIGDTSLFKNIFERYLLTFSKTKMLLLKNKRKKEGRWEERRDAQTKLNLIQALLEDS